MIGRNRLKAKIAQRAWREYMQFKRDMFHRKKRELWENCQKIHFYCCVMECFHYRRESSHDWATLVYCKQPIKVMWDCYQQNEHLEGCRGDFIRTGKTEYGKVEGMETMRIKG